ncbi:hypothetical protein D7V86_07860 [bacterium D16-51]|nr:hypothetical protein D7V96_09405 [bacterium D16-59]RKI60746.1 hypothetical protein D7V86_07860 [bacterium D16-51]
MIFESCCNDIYIKNGTASAGALARIASQFLSMTTTLQRNFLLNENGGAYAPPFLCNLHKNGEINYAISQIVKKEEKAIENVSET